MLSKYWSLISCYTLIPKDLFLEIVNFIFDNSFFKFNNLIYNQLDGTSMGNPSSPSIANFIMEILVTSVLECLPFEIPLAMYYVDDTLFAIPKDKLSDVIQTFNSFHPKIQFTYEMEKNQELPFLDIIVKRCNDGSIITNWYRKPSSSGRLLNFLSGHPLHQKVNTITNLIKRVNSLSHDSFMNENIEIIKKLLINNNYPKIFINKILHSTMKSKSILIQKLQPTTDPTVDTRIVRCKFPNFPILSTKIIKLFKKENIIDIVLYNTKTTNIFFSNLKDREPKENLSNLIYKINCGSCEKSYIGMTKQRFSKRIGEHKSTCRTTDNKKTALSEHYFTEGHIFNFKDASILEVENNYEKRKIAEVIHIILNEDKALNHKKDTEEISALYYNLLDNFRSKTNKK